MQNCSYSVGYKCSIRYTYTLTDLFIIRKPCVICDNTAPHGRVSINVMCSLKQWILQFCNRILKGKVICKYCKWVAFLCSTNIMCYSGQRNATIDNYKKCLKGTDHKFQGQYNIPDLPMSSP